MKTEASNMASKSPPVCPICGSDPCQLGVTIGDKWIFCHPMRRLKHAKFTNVPLCSPKKSSLNALPTLSEPGLVVLTDPDGPDSVTPDRLPCKSLGGSQASIVQLEEAPEPVETVSSSRTGRWAAALRGVISKAFGKKAQKKELFACRFNRRNP